MNFFILPLAAVCQLRPFSSVWKSFLWWSCGHVVMVILCCYLSLLGGSLQQFNSTIVFPYLDQLMRFFFFADIKMKMWLFKKEEESAHKISFKMSQLYYELDFISVDLLEITFLLTWGTMRQGEKILTVPSVSALNTVITNNTQLLNLKNHLKSDLLSTN